MLSIKCTRCKNEIYDVSRMVNILEDAGYTATYCGDCGGEARKKIEERDRSIL